MGDSRSQLALGFLTVVERAPHGLFGGYLVLNLAGRPLEFHCTAPIKPNRAQEILYGATLEPFLYGEHIGRALTEKSTLEPLLICTDREPALALREFVNCPVVLTRCQPQTLDSDNQASVERLLRIDAAQSPRPRLLSIQARERRVEIRTDRVSDQSLVQERLTQLTDEFDLTEPFVRICDAIDEAQRAGSR